MMAACVAAPAFGTGSMRDDSVQRREWTVTGMDCAACATKVQNALGRLPGISEVRVGLMSERLSLNLLPGVGVDGDVEDAVRRLGYGLSLIHI